MLASVDELMAEAFEGLADGFVDPRHEFDDVVVVVDIGLDHGEFVAAEPCDQVGLADAAAQPRATVFSNSSPTGWPSESLMPLNSSMSI